MAMRPVMMAAIMARAEPGVGRIALDAGTGMCRLRMGSSVMMRIEVIAIHVIIFVRTRVAGMG